MAYKKTKTTNGLNRFPKVKYLLVIGLLFLTPTWGHMLL